MRVRRLEHYWSVDLRRHGHHHVAAEDEEDIIQKKTAKQRRAHPKAPQRHRPRREQRERPAQKVRDARLRLETQLQSVRSEVERHEHACEDTTDN